MLIAGHFNTTGYKASNVIIQGPLHLPEFDSWCIFSQVTWFEVPASVSFWRLDTVHIIDHIPLL